MVNLYMDGRSWVQHTQRVQSIASSSWLMAACWSMRPLCPWVNKFIHRQLLQAEHGGTSALGGEVCAGTQLLPCISENSNYRWKITSGTPKYVQIAHNVPRAACDQGWEMNGSKGCWTWCAQHRTKRKLSSAKLGLTLSLAVISIILHINIPTLPLLAAIAINKTTLKVLFHSY